MQIKRLNPAIIPAWVPFIGLLALPPPAPGQEVVFGISFKRNIPRKNEEVTWPFISNDTSFYRPAEFGRLRGLHDIKTGRSIELRPYVLGGVDTVSDRRETRQEIGGYVKWGVTSGLTADFTVNTDFAQEEVDVQQINFTYNRVSSSTTSSTTGSPKHFKSRTDH